MTEPLLGRSGRPLLAACMSVALASCSAGDTRAVDPTPAATGTGSSAGSLVAPEDESSLKLEEAAELAVKAVDGSSLFSIETEPGRTIWEARVVTADGTEHEMLIAMADGTVVDGPTGKDEDPEDKAENRALVADATLSYQEAVQTISEVVGGASLMELNLDTFEDRVTTWEADLYPTDGVRYTVTIDAKSGEVLEKNADAEDDD